MNKKTASRNLFCNDGNEDCCSSDNPKPIGPNSFGAAFKVFLDNLDFSATLTVSSLAALGRNC